MHQMISTNNVQIPHIYTVGFSSSPRVTRYGPSVRNQYIIHYVLSGKGYFNGQALGRGYGFLITPGMEEEYHPDKADPWSFLWIISEDPSMQYFFDCHRTDSVTKIFSFHNPHEIEAIARELTSAVVFASSSRLAELFLHIFHCCVESKPVVRKSVTKIYFDFSVNYIKTNLHLPLTVETLCQMIGITQPYLYRIFKEEAGCSPKQYISSAKIARAKKLLSETELSVSQIADSVGFQSVLDFSKFFSRHEKLSPSAYRNACR